MGIHGWMPLVDANSGQPSHCVPIPDGPDKDVLIGTRLQALL